MYAGVLTMLFVIIILLLAVKRTGLFKPCPKTSLPADVPMFNQAGTDNLIAFLEEADNAYVRAYQYRAISELARYTTRDFAIEMQQKITYYNDKIWGAPSHRRTAWSIVSTDGVVITVRKELTFKKVKYGRMLVKIGDDCVEYWKIVYDSGDKCYKIHDITC